MDALIVLGSVAFGWILSQATDAVRASTRKTTAARLVLAELANNHSEMMTLRESDVWAGAPGGPRRSAWDAHQADLIWAGEPSDRDTIMRAYQELDHVAAFVRAADASGRPMKVPRVAADETITALEGAMVCLLPLCLNPVSRWRRGRHVRKSV